MYEVYIQRTGKYIFAEMAAMDLGLRHNQIPTVTDPNIYKLFDLKLDF